LSGPTGGSRLGRHLRFEPRVELGAWLHAQGATALMDVSDGLSLDLSRMATSSGVRIDLEHVPIHRDAERAGRLSGRTPEWHALNDGEDYELLATLTPARARAVLTSSSRLARSGGVELRRIGTVRKGQGLFLRRGDFLEELRFSAKSPGGWMHGVS
jgi:thiamine-monophosphate kinase